MSSLLRQSVAKVMSRKTECRKNDCRKSEIRKTDDPPPSIPTVSMYHYISANAIIAHAYNFSV